MRTTQIPFVRRYANLAKVGIYCGMFNTSKSNSEEKKTRQMRFTNKTFRHPENKDGGDRHKNQGCTFPNNVRKQECLVLV